jgi:Domain of unknown function (DUF6852)/Domain of unknown function (DUF5606)
VYTKTSIKFAIEIKAKNILELKDVVSIAGKPGLNVIVGQRPNGLIVETIDDQKKRFPTSLSQRVSVLEDISIYTKESDVKLQEVLRLLHIEVGNGLTLISKKNSGDEIRAFFRKVLPDFDESQVYNSDIIKVSAWYTILKDHINFEEEVTTDEANSDSKTVQPTKTKKPVSTPSGTQKGHTKGTQAKAPRLTQRKMS